MESESVNMLTSIVNYLPRVVLAVVALALCYWLSNYFSRAVAVLLKRSSLNAIHKPFFETLTKTLIYFIGLIFVFHILGFEGLAVSVLAGGGVTAVIFGFAFREIGENFLAGIFLSLHSPFRTGDIIRTEDIEGKVVSIDLRNTHLRTEDGRDVYVPSSQLFNRPVVNYTRDGLRRYSFSVGIDYANNARAACLLLMDTVAAVRGVLEVPEPGAAISELGPSHVELKVYFWIDMLDTRQEQLSIKTRVMDNCRFALLENGYTVSAETTTNIALKNAANSNAKSTD